MYIEEDDRVRIMSYRGRASRIKGRVSWTPGADLRQLAQDLLEAMEALKYSPATILHYRMDLKRLVSFLEERGHSRPQDVTPEDLTAYRLKLLEGQYSDKTINSLLRVVPQFFDCLEAGHVIFGNPAADFQVPKLAHRFVPVLDEQAIKRLLEQPDVSTPAGLRDRALLETAYATGARREELANLTLDRLNLARQTARLFGKGRKERVVPLGKHATYWLERYLKEGRPQLLGGNQESAVWIGSQLGRKVQCVDLGQLVSGIAKAANLKITTHGLRRACATHMLRRGAHPMLIQELLGHTGSHSLSHYLRLSLDDLKKTLNRSKPGR